MPKNRSKKKEARRRRRRSGLHSPFGRFEDKAIAL
jgi:hypothetical protein